MKELNSLVDGMKLVIFNKPRYIFVTAVTTLSQLMFIGMALLYGELVNMVSRGLTFSELGPMIIVTLIYTLIATALMWLSQYVSDKYGQESMFAMRNKYVSRLFNTKYSLLSNEDSSRYINNLTNDISRMVGVYAMYSMWFIVDVFMVVGTFISALVLSWKVALTMLGFVVVMAVLPLFIKKPLDKSIVELSHRNKEYIQSLKENLLGLTVIKNNNAEKVCADDIVEHNERYLAAAKRNVFVNSCAGGLGNMVRQIAVVALIIVTCYYVYKQEVEVGAVLSIFSIGSQFYGAILGTSSVVTSLLSISGTKDIVKEIMDYPELGQGEDIAFEKDISLHDVSFAYSSSDRVVLDGVNMTFVKNGKYLIIGKSGSGKSTVLKLLCKFYEPTKGSVGIDGTGYDGLNEKQINRIIAYSQQSGYMFNRSIRENIDFNKTADDARLNEVIRQVELESFVAMLPEGLDTVIDEEVNQVSGGEKLRINLARSLFRDSRVLLLDEVTSALDKRTSEVVEKNLLAIGDKTVINVCHKFNDETLPLYDRIYIIENGRVVLEGSFEELRGSDKLAAYRNVTDN